MTSQIFTVIDADARIRSGPPTFRWLYPERIPRYTRVSILQEDGKYVRLEGLRGKDFGWTVRSNLGTYWKDFDELDGALAPETPVAIPSAWPSDKKALAGTYNRLGGLLGRVASATRVATEACLAVWQVESGGRRHTPGRATIRFENHLLFRSWGDRHRTDYDRHFRHGGHRDVPGRSWQNHQFRETAAGSFESVHASQAANYRALALAERLAGKDAALQCISIGGPQILGSHFELLGYRSPASMYDAFQDSEHAHVLGFFDYCRYAEPDERLLSALRNEQWADFAAGYNGLGNVQTYSTRIASAQASALAIL